VNSALRRSYHDGLVSGENVSVADRQRFEFAFARAYRFASAPFGVTPTSSWVEVGAEELEAHFGPWRLRTPLPNIKAVEVTGPYRFVKTAGPARLAITDRGLTFATNGRKGVLIRFHSGVRGIDPAGLIRHPELTVTVADIDGLVAALEARRG
jgi:hypothetical protein